MPAGPKTLHSGWNPDLDIPSALTTVSVESGWTVLVSMLDSTPGVAGLPSLVPHLTRHGVPLTVVGGDVALVWSAFRREVLMPELLAGFDEVWLCQRVPGTGKPDTVRLTSDRPLLAETPAGLARWMETEGVVAGLGDGDGLNFATFDPRLAAGWGRSSS